MNPLTFVGLLLVMGAVLLGIVHLVVEVFPDRVERWREKRRDRRRLPEARAVRMPPFECTACSGRPSAGGYLCDAHRSAPARPFVRAASAGIREITRTAAQLELLRSLCERGLITRAQFESEVERIAPDPRDRRPEPTAMPGPGMPYSG